MSYNQGFRDGWVACAENYAPEWDSDADRRREDTRYEEAKTSWIYDPPKKKKRAPSAWNKFVKANSKKPRFIYQSGKKKGKLNLKKMGVAYRKTPAGKKR